MDGHPPYRPPSHYYDPNLYYSHPTHPYNYNYPYFPGPTPYFPPIQQQQQQRPIIQQHQRPIIQQPDQNVTVVVPPKVAKATTKAKKREVLPKIEAAAASALQELVASGQNVVVWKVSRRALAKLHADSWDSLGFSLPQIPFLQRLLVAEYQTFKGSMGTFLDVWKEACQDCTGLEVLERMLEMCKVKKGTRNQLISTFSTYPLVGFLNIGALSIKQGMWDSLNNTFQSMGELGQAVDGSVKTFVTSWREDCQKHAASEVFERMLKFYGNNSKRCFEIGQMFTTYPLVGFRDVTIASIKSGMWNNLCDAVQSGGQLGLVDTRTDELPSNNRLDVQPNEKDSDQSNSSISKSSSCVDEADIIRKVLEYLAETTMLRCGSSILDELLMLVEQLYSCEVSVAKEFSVSEFKLLGHGNFLPFLDRNISLLRTELLKSVGGRVQDEHQFLQVSMMQQQLIMLLSQASSNLWEEDVISKGKFSELLMRQYPNISLKCSEWGDEQKLLDMMRKHKSSVASNTVIYSATLLGTSNYTDSVRVGEIGLDNSELTGDTDHIRGNPGSVTSKDAIKVLLKAPFLYDLNSWSHWDVVYAPTLGPLIEWLLAEVNTEGLICLSTKDCKIIRVDNLATGDLFFQALIEASPFKVAAQLLSLFALSGGRRHVPLSLLKCQASKGFKVIMDNAFQTTNFSDHQRTKDMSAACDLHMNLDKSFRGVNKALCLVSRILIDCLGFLPSEFRCFAADVLLSGLHSLFKDAASAALLHCRRTEERLMLHEVGLSLGIVAWVNDHSSLCLTSDNDYLISTGASSLGSGVSGLKRMDNVQCPCNELHLSTVSKYGQRETHTNLSSALGVTEVNDSGKLTSLHLAEPSFNEMDATFVIESIRRKEFGLDPNTCDVDSSLLKKQHARLGRALHCLSEGLYSQDAHFLLELVQNADDNVYSRSVEPTLSFILQHASIVILNNERGFTADDMRALCDVGNSTKKGFSAGYIGQKGIGFKSVFRVTDAPEIHSHGFHVKFDITEGLIGFVLPTIVPPCDIGMFEHLASGDTNMGMNYWNTCIVLPFKKTLTEGSAVSSILSMFSDLHHSLLLFLQRLQCIKLRNLINDSYIVLKKEILGNGIVVVSHGDEKTTWFVSSNRLRPIVDRSSVQMTEISIAFMLKETNGDYEPVLHQQPVFAFLPLRTYGLKFILQADFVLPSSREEVDGDSPWNQWLLSEFPDLFVSSEKPLCLIPCFRENPAKAVNVYMSFVPLIGEVHGFFSGLPRMIIYKLRQSNCLLEDGSIDNWVPPYKVLRGWNDQVKLLLPDSLLHEHLGLGLLHKDIDLCVTLARALGVEEYGPKTLVKFISSLGCVKDGIKSMGLGWLFAFLVELYRTFQSHILTLKSSEWELDLINSLKKVSFIPLSDGTYGSLDEGTIWLHDYITIGVHNESTSETYPNLYATLRTVSPSLFTQSNDVALIISCTGMLQKIGVQLISAHELIRLHILPSLSDCSIDTDQQLMTDYFAFVMLHLHSSCGDCQEADIISEFRDKTLIRTNHGYKRPAETPIHFSREFGNPFDANKLLGGLDYVWDEVDAMYLKHPITKTLSCGVAKWRDFFQKLGITDFVKVVLSEKSSTQLFHPALDEVRSDRHLISSGLMAKDWESPELVQILSLLSRDGSQERCRYLLEVLDALWDDHFSDKVFGWWCSITSPNDSFFKSSLLTCISDNKWVVSSVDSKLHYPNELFHDCDDVRSILGYHAAYAVPKIKSDKLLSSIGFKTQVRLDDVLAIVQTWKELKPPYTASLSQICKLYTFMWKQLATSRQQVMDVLRSAPFIFVPYDFVKVQEDFFTGIFLSPEEVYWHDSTGALEHIMDNDTSVANRTSSILSKKKKNKKKNSIKATSIHLSKALSSFYPGLHDFFVLDCNVNEAPSFRHYLQILQQLSRTTSAIKSADVVFQIFLKWSNGLKCGTLQSNDVTSLKECLTLLEYTILPSMQNKWVSLHSSFGLVCWSDDNSLKKEFEQLDGIVFLYLGELTNNSKQMLYADVAALLRSLGIPFLSEVVSREAIYYGLVDSTVKTIMLEWVLQFAQCYVYNLHQEKYRQLKLTEFNQLHQLQIVVVERLSYRNVIKKCDCISQQMYECTSLLQGNILYTTQESDPHSVFLEFSRLLFDGNPDLHLANFLQMVTVMAESCLSDEQIKVFMLNSQKMVEVPSEDSVWSLSAALSSLVNAEMLPQSACSTGAGDQIYCKSGIQAEFSSCHPTWLETASAFGFTSGGGIRTQAVTIDQFANIGTSGDYEGQSHVSLTEIIKPELTTLPCLGNNCDNSLDLPGLRMEVYAHPTDLLQPCRPEDARSKSSGKDQLLPSPITSGSQLAILTGRQGELVAFRYFAEKAEGAVVKWVNQEETGLPYDIVIGEEDNREYIEVKASRFARKNWVEISTREWQFAAEKGDKLTIAHVILSGHKLAKLIVYKDPVKLCQSGKLQLAVMTLRWSKDPSK